MGKPNWKAGIALASYGLRKNREENRAYERQDREAAQQLYAEMLKSGVDPANLNMDASGLGQYMKEALSKYGPLMKDADRRKAEEEAAAWEDRYLKQKAIDLEFSPTMNKPIEPTDEKKRIAEFSGMSMDDFNNLANDQRRALYRQYYKTRRKEESGGGFEKRPRYTIREDKVTGAVYKFDLDTNQETLVKPETSEHKKNREKKEQKQFEADTLKRETEARKIFDQFAEGDKSDERLNYHNEWLKLYGKKIVKKPAPGFFGSDTYDLLPLEVTQSSGNPEDPLGINQ